MNGCTRDEGLDSDTYDRPGVRCSEKTVGCFCPSLPWGWRKDVGVMLVVDRHVPEEKRPVGGGSGHGIRNARCVSPRMRCHPTITTNHCTRGPQQALSSLFTSDAFHC